MSPEERYAQLWQAEVAAPAPPAPKPPGRVTPTADLVMEILRKHPSGLTASDIAHKAKLTRYAVCRVMQRLRGRVRITMVKQIMIYEAVE